MSHHATKFVYFDLGNVLVNFDHRIAVEQLARRAARPEALVRRVVFDSDLQNRYETGLVSSTEFAAAINMGLESDLPCEEILEAISAIFEPNDAILRTLQFVHTLGLPTGILSNTCEAHWQWIAKRQWPVMNFPFREVVLSYEVGGMKPEALIYEVCEQRAGCTGPAIFFADDRADNIEAAASRGWTTHQFTSAEGLQQRLERWLSLTSA